MAKEGSVAPKERINIKYVPATGDQQEEIELPLKLLMLGDFTGKPDDTILEERRTISVDKTTFPSVMKEANLERTISVNDKLTEGAGEEDTLTINLKFDSLKDFEPDSIMRQVPELEKLMNLREALVALKTPLGNLPQFRKSLQSLLSNDEQREKILEELSVSTQKSDDEVDTETKDKDND